MSSPLQQENLENTCVVCFKNVFIYSIGECDHAVCYECSTRMRVLCRQNECPICRQDMPKVIFLKDIKPFRTINTSRYVTDKKFKICFESSDVQAAYNKLLEHVCSRCHGYPAFRTFQLLKEHMRREHELYYCDLCVDNLKIFTGERRCYTRQELAQHRRKGDSDDRSHRGHPLCEFCDQRYMDNDELFRHLRRDHLFCHFCDTDGYHQYYSSYDFLRDHFRAEHFLCEEGGCSEEKFTSVFRSEIDLKAHRASVHGRSMGKAAVKQARTLELEFTLAPRMRDRLDGSKRVVKGRQKPEDEDSLGAVGGFYDDGYAENKTFYQPQINTDCIEEFPTLSGSVTTGFSAPIARTNTRHVAVNNGGVTIRTVRQSQPPLAVTDENFPVLGGDSNCKTVRLSVNSNNQDHLPLSSTVGTSKAPTNLSIHVNHHPRGTALSTRLSSSQNFQLRPPSKQVPSTEDFPSLLGSKKTVPNSAEWLTNLSSNNFKSKGQTSHQNTNTKKHFTVAEDFPSLNSDFKSKCNTDTNTKSDNHTKKASSLMIPVSSSWPSQSKSAEESTGSRDKPNDDTSNNILIRNIKVKSKKKKLKNTTNSNTRLNNNHKEPINVSENVKLTKQTESIGTFNNVKSNETSKTNSFNSVDQMNRDCDDLSKHAKDSNRVERKRSELLIAKLVSEESAPTSEPLQHTSSSNMQNDFSMAVTDFPSLGSSAICPPGFLDIFTNKSTIPAPPPGFVKVPGGSVKNPPPGFGTSLNPAAQSSNSNNLTFTNSNGQQYYILPDSPNHQFVPPPNSSERNELLYDKVLRCISNFEEFKQYSTLFKQGAMSAENYYNQCLQLMDPVSFKEIFPELLLLLPNIRKQQELLSAHTMHSGEAKSSLFEVCATCGQVLSPNDLCRHLASHHFENHFPSLDTSKSKSSLQPAWGRSQ